MGNGNPPRPLNRRGPRHIGSTRAWTAPASSGHPSPTNELDKPLFVFDGAMTPTPSCPPKRGSCYTIYEVATPPSLDLADNARSFSQNSSDTSGSCSMSFSPPNPMHPHAVQSGYSWTPRPRVSPSYTPYCTCYSTEHNPYASPTSCYYHPYYPNAPVQSHYPMRPTSYLTSPTSYESASAPPSRDASYSGYAISVSSDSGSASPPPPPQDQDHERDQEREREEEMCPALRIYEESKRFYGWYM
ncbi:hypothetical protein NLI96_g8310 [Meripilus lineatus]|uniref:Uncharacterized protein n=1 Tax=Meripilus lineatus TaxID=2056292 RepID=A0AAD5UXL5_9APHY|nr:hypothetical protein NLI96_g8310 [Physisporinus lineatus]